LEDVDDLYKLYGWYEVCGKMGTNHLLSGLRGPNNIKFKDGQHIRFGYPSYKLGGTLYGERTVETVGSIVFEDLTNQRKAVIITGTFKSSGWVMKSSTGSKDEVSGIIYQSYNLTGDRKSIKKHYEKDCEMVSDLKKLKDIKKKICDV